MSTVSGSARVQVTVEFATSSWGEDCPLSQVYRQAGEETMHKVARLITAAGGHIVGAPKVIAVLVPNK